MILMDLDENLNVKDGEILSPALLLLYAAQLVPQPAGHGVGGSLVVVVADK